MPHLPRPILAVAMTLALATPAFAFAGGDAKTRPQDDLFRHANGGWLDATAIPGDKSRHGTFTILREQSDEIIKKLLANAAANPGRDRESQLVGDYYAALIDLEAIAQAGLTPLADVFARIDRLETLDHVAEELGRMVYDGATGPVLAYPGPDAKDPTVNAVTWYQSGLGLPDRDYYLKPGDEAEALRQSYRAYLVELHRLAGFPEPEAAALAILNFETAIAQIQWSRVDRRDAVKTYNPVPKARWAELGAFPWQRFAQASGMPAHLGANAHEPSYLKAFSALAAETPIAVWKTYLKGRFLTGYASILDQRFRAAHHRFKGEKLQGLKEQPALWKVAVEETNNALGMVVGQRYVEAHFPPAAKARMQTLVTNLMSAYRESLAKLEWMSPKTRAQALDKLAKFTVKIGYPDKWPSYDGLVVKRDDAVGNMRRVWAYDYARDMKEAGKPVDRSRWHMNPQMVNAYYSPPANEIVFPAAILQPPFFDLAGDDAYNYGAIGAVIGHEISHGFDDSGRRYDGEGRLRDWWTPEDAEAFNARAQRLVAQYGAYEPLPGVKVNGQLTLGENIADLAGVKMAYQAYQLSLGGKPAPVVDGQTGAQRFVLGYARAWRSKSRDEYTKMRVTVDSHSPEQYRTNGVVTNLDAFHEAFGVQPGDKLYRKPEDRIRVW